jgi:hypothetical protein
MRLRLRRCMHVLGMARLPHWYQQIWEVFWCVVSSKRAICSLHATWAPPSPQSTMNHLHVLFASRRPHHFERAGLGLLPLCLCNSKHNSRSRQHTFNQVFLRLLTSLIYARKLKDVSDVQLVHLTPKHAAHEVHIHT